ncbi:MAG TPA: tyrosine-type recombinase/integrase, partial [Solirubrobacteraceae bacterium]|nr:tyrosine-type recombinase/integrase [Solirubrobacteraceae bacterium]
ERFIAANEAAWTNEVHRGQVRTTLATYTFPTLGDLPVSAIDQALVLEVLRPIWQTKHVTASRVRSRIESVLNFAKGSGWREGDNPASWDVLQHALGKAKPQKTHHPAMAYSDVPAFLGELQAREGSPARALEVAILTALRTSEVLGARWDEINLAERVWVIPADRMKAGLEHRVPLSDRVIEILSSLPHEEGNPFLFVGDKPLRPLHAHSMFVVLRTMRPVLTVHGFRSSFSDWAHNKATTDNYVIEMCLAHKVGSSVEQAYLRSTLFDKRRALMSAWAALGRKPTPAEMAGQRRLSRLGRARPESARRLRTPRALARGVPPFREGRGTPQAAAPVWFSGGLR